MVAHFLAGLRNEIADVVQLQQYWTYEDVCRLALKVEGQCKRKNSGSGSTYPNRFQSKPSSQSSSVVVAVNEGENGKSVVKEGQHGGTGKGAATAKRCFKCQGLGDFVAECPNRQFVTLSEEVLEPIFDEYEEEPNDVQDEEGIVYADSGESLVIRLVLNVAAVEDESWLQHNIFHT